MIRQLSIVVMLVLFSGLYANAAGASDFSKLTSLATTVSKDVAHGQWSAAQKTASLLRSDWVAMRPSVATTRLQTAHAETIDASIAWMLSAIQQKHASGAQDASALIVRTVRHLVEDHGQ